MSESKRKRAASYSDQYSWSDSREFGETLRPKVGTLVENFEEVCRKRYYGKDEIYPENVAERDKNISDPPLKLDESDPVENGNKEHKNFGLRDANLATTVKLGTEAAVKGVKVLNEFREFILKGKIIEFSMGVIIAGALQILVNSIVDDIVGPIIALVFTGGTLEESFFVLRSGTDGRRDFYTRQAAASAGAITFNYGSFLQTLLRFCLVAVCLYFVIKTIYTIYREEKHSSTSWPCPRCKELVKEGAFRCSNCCAEPIYPHHKYIAPYMQIGFSSA